MGQQGKKRAKNREEESEVCGKRSFQKKRSPYPRKSGRQGKNVYNRMGNWGDQASNNRISPPVEQPIVKNSFESHRKKWTQGIAKFFLKRWGKKKGLKLGEGLWS